MLKRMKFIRFVSLIILLTIVQRLYSQEKKYELFDTFKWAVVLIENIVHNHSGPSLTKFVPRGTGFFVADVAIGKFLVSNKHVFVNKDSIALRIYSGREFESPIQILPLKDNKGNNLWIGHPDPNVDIAVLKINPIEHFIDEGNSKNLLISGNVIPLSRLANDSLIHEGDDVYILGYPLGLRTSLNSIPLWRKGIIALKPTSDFLLVGGENNIGKNIYIIDTHSLGGSSGSPIFLNKVQQKYSSEYFITEYSGFLVGIVSGHLTDLLPVQRFQDSLYVEANSGLAIVHPAYQIKEVIELAK